MQDTILDVAIVGGGAGGLSAALVLGRMRRHVIVIDGGEPRNAPSHGVHGFLSRDGIAPAELLQIGRDQLQPYSTVSVRKGFVTQAVQREGYFELTLKDGDVLQARKLLLATGVKDILPDIEGLRDFWGTSVAHCPYCHGWEARDTSIAILLKTGEHAIHMATLLHPLSNDLVVCTNDEPDFTTEQRQQLESFGVPVYDGIIERVEGTSGRLERLVFADGRTLERQTIFVEPYVIQHTDLAQQLGCALKESGLVEVDHAGETSVPGVYAVGDMANPAAQVVVAAYSGMMAAAMINRELAAQAFHAVVERE